ncbi:hypothetical protein RB595_010187 [Gaeumannomyces hyphopodioides]
MSDIVINGKSSSQLPQADAAQKTELKGLAVQIQEFLTDETQQIYLCRYSDDPLEPIRSLNYIDSADVYASDFVIHDAVERMRARPVRRANTNGPPPHAAALVAARHVDMPASRSAPMFYMEAETPSYSHAAFSRGDNDDENIVEVDVLLHHDIGEVPDGLIDKISAIHGLKKLVAESGVVRLEIDEAALEAVAQLDEVRVIHPVNERMLMTNVARRLLGFPDNDDTVAIDPPAITTAAIVNGTPGDGEAVAVVSGPSCRYRGHGQIVCVADTGFDKDSTTDVHEAFTGRVVALHPFGRKGAASDPDGHGTHVCGSVLGTGVHSSEGRVAGSAPGASLILQSFFERFDWQNHPKLTGYPADLGILFKQAYDAGARIHSNSWGSPLLDGKQRPYEAAAESIDRFVWRNQDMTVLFAAGNEGQDTELVGRVSERSLGAEAAAKNCITVGASESDRPTLTSGNKHTPYTYGLFWPRRFPRNPLKDDHQADNPDGLAAFSSRGPTAENRIKPDVVAPGTAILSARSRAQDRRVASSVDRTGVSGDDRFEFLSGTSMATPLVARCCAVVRKALLAHGYLDLDPGAAVANPTGSLVKALIINGAVPIAGTYVPDDLGHGPNPHSGFGRVNIADTLAMIEPTTSGMGGYGIGSISEETEEPFTARIPVPTPATPGEGRSLTFKVTLAYADLPGSSLANDLNLVVVSADGARERHGNQGDDEVPAGAEGPFDRRNNVEQVVWPRVDGDDVQVVVKPYRLMLADVPFAYTWKFF